MEKTWKPTTAGILNLITGAISIFGVIGLAVALTAASTWGFILDAVPAEELPFTASLVSIVLIVALVLSVIEAVFPILGGVFAVQRKHWGWALAGSIIAILALLPLGILATIFVALSKNEFE